MDRNQEYIRLLQERNRMKKVQSEKSAEDLQKEELEKGFSINFRGANAAKQASKTLDKPVVKVQKGLSADVARRLLGGEDSDNGKKRWTQEGEEEEDGIQEISNKNRSTSAARRRRPSAGADDSATPREDDNSSIKIGSQSKNKNTSKVDDVLLQRIKSMNQEQKKALLDLLQISDPTIDDNDDDISKNEEMPQFTGRKGTDQDNLNLNVTSEDDAVVTATEITPLKDENISKVVTDDSAHETEMLLPSYDWTSHRFNIRVKIFSTWDDCKNCVLQAMRCRVNISAGQFFDVLHISKVQLSCGLNVLPTSLEVYRKLPVLLSMGHSSTNPEQWKGPVTLTQPLELSFECVIVEPENCALSDYFVDFASLLEHLELLIWNGFQEDSGVNYSPVKDADIYVDGKCIWSGQIPTTSAAADVTKASSTKTSPLKYEAETSLSVQVVPQSKKQSNSRQVDSQSEFTRKPSDAKDVHPSSNRNDNTNSMPVWLKSSEGSSSDNSSSVLAASLNIGVRNSRRSEDIVFNSPPRSSVVSGAIKTLKSISPEREVVAVIPEGAIPAKKAVSRGSRRNAQRQSQQQLDIISESSDSAVPVTFSPAKNLARSSSNTNTGLLRNGSKSLLDDDVVRRSIDAVQRAEKFNLNRLEKSREMKQDIFTSQEDALAAVAGSALAVHTPISSPMQDGAGMVSAKTTYSGDRGMSHEASSYNKPISQSKSHFSPGSPLTNKKTSAATAYQPSSSSPSARLGKRAANIGEFSVKLTNKINEVNDILALLPRKPSTNNLSSAVNLSPGNDSSPQSIPAATKQQQQQQPKVVVPVSTVVPTGRVLQLWIYSTHGDANYVGLNGIELFDEVGNYVPSQTFSIAAIPSDLTILPGYEDDPRKVSNLVDGVNNTKDDLHQWLAPQVHVAKEFVSSAEKMLLAETGNGALAMIRLQFTKPAKLSMIRIYNFNKSRTHNQRGVKSIRILLDEVEVFAGDVAKATGQTGKGKAHDDDCLVIPLSRDTTVLNTIAAQTEAMLPESAPEEDNALEESMVSVQSRPKTAVPPDDSLSQVVLADTTPTMSFGGDESLDVVDGEDVDGRHSLEAAKTEEQAFHDSLQTSTDFLHAIMQETDAIQMRNAYQQKLQQAKAPTSSTLGSYLQQKQQRQDPSNEPSSTVRRPSVDAVCMPHTMQTTTTTISPPGTRKLVKSDSSSASVNATSTTTSTTTYVRTLKVQYIRLELLTSWGDREYIGLGGLEVLNYNNQPIRLNKSMLRCDSSSDLGGFGGVSDRSDLNQLLVSGHDTANTQAMWLVPQDHERKKVIIDIDLQSAQEIIGLKVWNYNGTTMDEIFRGCRLMNIMFDNGKVKMTNLVLRLGPMYDGVRFPQLFTFDRWIPAVSQAATALANATTMVRGGTLAYITPRLKQTYEVMTPITGLSFVFSFYSNHGDHYYLGIDKMEFLDEDLQVIDVLSLSDVTAVPYSVRDLAQSAAGGMSDTNLAQDPRIPPAIFLPSHYHALSQPPSGHMSAWLAPLTRSMLPAEREVCVQRIHSSSGSNGGRLSVLPPDNTLFVSFHFPVRVAAIRIWNYSKSPTRGVKEFCLSVDGNTVFMGSLLSSLEEKKVDALSRNEIPGTSRGQVMLFSNETRHVNQFKDLVIVASAGDQDVLCINERQVMVRSKTMYQEPPSQIDIQQRPTTSFVR